MANVAIHLFHGDTGSLGTGSRVAEWIRQVSGDQFVDLEVYCFGPAQGALIDTSGEPSQVRPSDRRVGGGRGPNGGVFERSSGSGHRGGPYRSRYHAPVREGRLRALRARGRDRHHLLK